MSSAAGPRAAGSDGSDWKYREKVAEQFVTSVKFKNFMKRTLLYHGMVGTTIFGTAFMVGMNSLYLWQVLWIMAFPACFIGFKALYTNNSSYMWFYRMTLMLISAPCVLWGIGATLGFLPHQEFYSLVGLEKPKKFLMPNNNNVVYFLGFTTVCSHLYSLLCISKILNAWDVTKRKNKGQ